MPLTHQDIEDLIFGRRGLHRFTQDSPVLPDVWVAYGTVGANGSRTLQNPVDLILTPTRESDSAQLLDEVAKRLELERQTLQWRERHAGQTPSTRLSYNDSYVVAQLSFDELVRALLPLTKWWSQYVWRHSLNVSDLESAEIRQWLATRIGQRAIQGSSPADPRSARQVSDDLLWMVLVIGRIEWERQQLLKQEARSDSSVPPLALVETVYELVRGLNTDQLPKEPVLWSVSRNRPIEMAMWRSVVATKADAASRLFNLSCAKLRWAIIDSGVDAKHPAFRRRIQGGADNGKPYPDAFPNENGRVRNRTRIVGTYDFTRLRTHLCMEISGEASPPGTGGPQMSRQVATSEADVQQLIGPLDEAERRRVLDMREGLKSGRSIDWRAMEAFLRVPIETYHPPISEHGTHVAGILAGDWRLTDDVRVADQHDLMGVCPDLEMYDLRVLDDEGRGSEFAVLAALQFVRWLNASKDEPVIHGVNISLSLLHDVANYACGRTPVCEECERLVGTGVVVVVAAGNEGYAQFTTSRGPKDGYRSISITDPGNAEGVITVGSTHRFKPHTYGVSYFSSRGPTGDGRSKPDIVAPGEKIKSAIPGGRAKSMDGTSMAAPHVSGAAALLLARHGELVGHPLRVKQILSKTATDLGRERFFQGSGMVDVLRALQSV